MYALTRYHSGLYEWLPKSDAQKIYTCTGNYDAKVNTRVPLDENTHTLWKSFN